MANFSVEELSLAMERLPNLVLPLSSMNLFPQTPQRTKVVRVDRKTRTVSIVDPSQAGPGKGQALEREDRDVVSFDIPLYPLEDMLLSEDSQDVRAFGAMTPELPVDRLAELMQQARVAQDMTWEFTQWAALYGQMIDSKGKVIVDYFQEFGGDQKTVYFDLDNDASNLKAHAKTIKRHIARKLVGDSMSGITVKASPEFMDKFEAHANFKAAFERHRDGFYLRDDDEQLRFGGLRFSECNETVPAPSGEILPLVPESQGVAFPVGTRFTYRTAVAPAPFNDTVNRLGRFYNTRVWEMQSGEGWHFKSQSRFLPYCARPEINVILDAGTEPAP